MGAMEIQDENEFVLYGLDLLNLSPFVAEQIPIARLITVGNADPLLIEAVIAESNGSLYVAMDNCPHQVILCGPEAAVANALSRLQNRGAVCSLLPHNRPYHTPLYQPICDQFSHVLQGRKIVPPHTTIYSCATAQPYPHEPAEIRRIAAEQWARPVCFRETIEALYNAGVRIFVEVGPRGNLTGFVDDILRNHQYLAVPSNVPYRSGTTQLNYMVGLLAAHGVSMRLDYLYRHREPQHLSFETGEVCAAKSEERMHSIRLAQELPMLRLGHNSKRSASDVPPSIQINQNANPHSQDSFRSKAMQDYLQTMEQFLATQQEIMAAFLARAAKTYPDTIFSTSCPQLVSHLPPSLGFQCCRLSEMGTDGLQALTHNVLSHQELKTWLHLPGHEKRRKEWLSGRLVAKDAVRLFLKNRYQLKASPPDIEITTDTHGRPIAGGELIEKLGSRLTISITHSAGSAVAVAGEYDGHVGVGIDMERVGQKHEGLERMALTKNEQALLSGVQASRREEWLIRLWCAKESVAKALGRGMAGGPNSLVVQGLEEETGRVSLALMGELARQLPTYANRLFNAYTRHEGDFVL